MEREEAEELLARKLTEEIDGDASAGEKPEVLAARKLAPRWEIRIQAQLDPVVEETKAYRAVAREVDDRYDNVKADSEDGDKEEGSSR